MDVNYNHELNIGDQVQLNFYSGSNPQPTDVVVTVDSIVDLNTWTFLAPSAGTNLGTNQGNNSVYQFPLKSLPLVRSGTLSSRPSTFNMGNTNADLDQSPINSPTVFNFYLPDYKFPGALASQGLTTPEFQVTAETSVIRQANFLYNGLFNPGNTNGISSFKSGTNALVMDFGPWMGNAVATVGTPGEVLGAGPQTGQPWTSNANVGTLIDRISTLLTAGQLSSAAKGTIQNFVARKITSITTGNPCTVTTTGNHGLVTGESIVISGVSNGTISPTLNNTSTGYVVTVTAANKFTIPVNCTAAPNATGLANAHCSVVPYNQSAPSDTHKRDRIRAIIHLILTSPDFTIQR
jgi:hypothetical protein